MAYGGTKAGTSGKYSQSGVQGSGKIAGDHGSRGIIAGGTTDPPHVNTIDYINIGTPANAIDFGDLATANYYVGGFSDGIRGAICGGVPSGEPIQVLTILTTGNAVTYGQISDGRYLTTGTSDGSRGVMGGGYAPPAPNAVVSTVDKISCTTFADGIDFGEVSQARSSLACCTNGSRVVWAGGGAPARVDVIDYRLIGSEGTASDFGNLTAVGDSLMHGNISDGNRAIWGPGEGRPADAFEYVTISTTSNALDYGEMSEARYAIGACSDGSRGIFAGGRDLSEDVIDFFPIAKGGTAVDFGNLTQARYGSASFAGG